MTPISRVLHNDGAIAFQPLPLQKVHFMRSFFRVAAGTVVLVNLALLTPTFAAGTCVVDDPTGTPLNVRASPNGAIVTTLANGTQVEVVDEVKLGAKHWFFVAQHGQRLGWIFGAYVVCPKDGDEREAAPSQPADQR
jgi:hypothetical protein